MAKKSLKSKIRRALRKICSPADRVHVLDLGTDYVDADQFVHVYIISRKLSRLRAEQKGDLIWETLFHELSPDEWGSITLTRVISPEKADGMAAKDLRTVW